MHILLLCLTLLLCIFVATTGTPPSTSSLEPDRQESARVEDRSVRAKKTPPAKRISSNLTEVARATMANYFAPSEDKLSLDDFIQQFEVPDNYREPAGLFVTFYRNGKTRACWGSVEPIHENLVKATVYATLDALRKEYRHKPIKENELNSLKTQVTVVRNIEPINSIHELDPLKNGLMVNANGKGAVILPGESSDAHHQMVMARLKAGINAKESCQMYRLETDVIN